MLIEVTEEDIKKGIPRDDYFCPITLAISRCSDKIPAVYNFWIVIDGKKYPHTKKLIQFIADFDAGKPVKPFRFRLKI